MLWAIFRISNSIKGSAEFSNLFNQRMVVTHFITFVVYIVSTFTYYIFSALYTDIGNHAQENEMYISWAIAALLLALV